MSVVRLGVLWLIAAAAAMQYLSLVGSVLLTDRALVDFRVYLEAAESAQAGESLYLRGYRYPPTLALLLTPLTRLSPLTAQRVWTLLDQGLLVTALWLSWRCLPRSLAGLEIPLAVAATFAFFPLYPQLKLGQMGNSIFVLVAVMATAWHAGRPLRAGGAVAVAGLLKVYPIGLAAWLLRQGAGPAVVLIGLACAGLLWLPDAVFHGAWLSDYVRSLPQMFASGASPIKADNQSFFAFIARVGAAPEWQSMGFAFALLLAAGALMLTLAWSPTGRVRGDVTAISITAAFLPLAWANPASWAHNYVTLLLAVPALVQRLARRLATTRRRADVLAASAALTAWVLMSQPYRIPRLLGHGEAHTDPVAMLLRSTFLCGTIIMWMVMLREMRLARQDGLASGPCA